MNNFEQTFFKKYVPEWQEIIEFFHRHWIKIIDDIILSLGLWVLIPIFLYYNSFFLQKNIEFKYLEIYLIIVYIIIIYKIFDWYNDVLILTNKSVIKIDWSLFKTKMQTTDYEHIEWIEISKNWIFDSILQKWDLIIQKFWADEMFFDETIKPDKIADKIESITSKIEHPEENDKFDLMMDALGWMVQNYLWNNNKKREDIFEIPYSISPKGIEKATYLKNKLGLELQEEFLRKVENESGTVDLR